MGEGGPVTQEQVGRPERAGAYHQVGGIHRGGLASGPWCARRVVPGVGDPVAAVVAGLDAVDLGQGPDLGPGIDGAREVVVVESVLGPVVAADVAFAAQPARSGGPG